jgi:glycosyltransferase A (GT-A) superfamily protein (DUF2064 family)
MASQAERRVLAYAPAERAVEFAALVRCAGGGRSWLMQPQSAGDLGVRMDRFFRDSLELGAERVVLIGSDSPTLPVEFVHQAFDELRDREVVLGPSDDGGYYLIGLARAVGSAVRTDVPGQDELAALGPQSGPYPFAALFDGIPWSTPQVWPRTITRLDRQGYSYAVLPTWYDVDEPADLDRLREELRRVTADESLGILRQRVSEILGG